MAQVAELTDVALWSPDEIKGKTDDELLEAVWVLESVYKHRDHEHDHRRYLSREELENVFILVQHLAQLRMPRPAPSSPR